MKTTVTFSLDFWATDEIYLGRGRVQMQKIVQFDCIPRYDDVVIVGKRELHMLEAIYRLDNSVNIILNCLNLDIGAEEALEEIANYVCNLGFSVVSMTGYPRGHESSESKINLFPEIAMTPEGLAPYLEESK